MKQTMLRMLVCLCAVVAAGVTLGSPASPDRNPGIAAPTLSDEPQDRSPSPSSEQGDAFDLRCTVNKDNARFEQHARAIGTEDGGLLLVGYHDGAALMIQLPKLHTGTFRLSDEPGLRLNYSRDVWSSDSRDHFAANAGRPESEIEVRVERLDDQEKTIQGTFSAVAFGDPEGQVRITNGVFHLRVPPVVRVRKLPFQHGRPLSAGAVQLE